MDVETGRFQCFACGAWGYMEWARRQWREERRRIADPAPYRKSLYKPVQPARADLAEVLRAYQAALPGSPGEEYIQSRGIPLGLAQEYGLGFAGPGKWVHPAGDWKCGRVVFPHTDPDGRVVSLCGRAIGDDDLVPKRNRHDHLPGAKGYFNASVLAIGEGPVSTTEGPFDALTLIAAGYRRAVAIFGTNGWRWEWARKVQQLIFAMDADDQGQRGWRELARQARLRGKDVAFLPPEGYGGHKDVNEAWVAGTWSRSNSGEIWKWADRS